MRQWAKHKPTCSVWKQVYAIRVCGLMDKAPDFGSGDCRFESCHTRANRRLRGATVARLTPDQKVACSNHVGVMYASIFTFYFSISFEFSQLFAIKSNFASYI